MSTIKHQALWQVKYHRDELKGCRRARKLIRLLSPEIQALDGRFAYLYGDHFMIEAHGEQAMDLLFDAGAVFESKYQFSGEQETDIEDCHDFSIRGKMMLDGLQIRVFVNKLPKPETCEVEAVTEMVTRYVAKCQETGKEL